MVGGRSDWETRRAVGLKGWRISIFLFRMDNTMNPATVSITVIQANI